MRFDRGAARPASPRLPALLGWSGLLRGSPSQRPPRHPVIGGGRTGREWRRLAGCLFGGLVGTLASVAWQLAGKPLLPARTVRGVLRPTILGGSCCVCQYVGAPGRSRGAAAGNRPWYDGGGSIGCVAAGCCSRSATVGADRSAVPGRWRQRPPRSGRAGHPGCFVLDGGPPCDLSRAPPWPGGGGRRATTAAIGTTRRYGG